MKPELDSNLLFEKIKKLRLEGKNQQECAEILLISIWKIKAIIKKNKYQITAEKVSKTRNMKSAVDSNVLMEKIKQLRLEGKNQQECADILLISRWKVLDMLKKDKHQITATKVSKASKWNYGLTKRTINKIEALGYHSKEDCMLWSENNLHNFKNSYIEPGLTPHPIYGWDNEKRKLPLYVINELREWLGVPKFETVSIPKWEIEMALFIATRNGYSVKSPDGMFYEAVDCL